MTDSDKQAMKPSEQRTAERRQQKQDGRARRAELLIERGAKEKTRQDALEDRQSKLDGRVGQLEARLEAHEKRIQQLEAHETRIQQLEALAARVSPRPTPPTPNP